MMESKPIILVTRNLTDIFTAIKNSTRLKYHCITTSSTYISLGASTGSIYLFSRQTGNLIKFISNKVHPITLLRFTKDEKVLAAADSAGFISCWEVTSDNVFKLHKEFNEFSGQTITSMCWSDYHVPRLFVGSQSGTVISFGMGFSGFSKSNIENVQKKGDPIVQMDFSNGRLVISSTSKAILCHTDRYMFQQIGKKTRDGQYGACFMNTSLDNQPIIYSARPGSRLWQIDFDGQVLLTHQFKELLAVPPTPLVLTKDIILPSCDESTQQPQSFNFPFLHTIHNRYLLTQSPKGICIFDTCNWSLVSWNDQLLEISDISCCKDSIYVLHKNNTVTEIQLHDTKTCLRILYKLEEWKKLAEVSMERKDEILDDVKSFLAIDFHNVLFHVKESNEGNVFHAENIKKYENFVDEFQNKYSEVRAVIQESLNKPFLDHSFHKNPEEDDDNKSSCSGHSDGGSSFSSRFTDVYLENIVQKATSVVVSKVIKTGFMKKAFREALQKEGVVLDDSVTPKQQQQDNKKTRSVPNSPRQSRTVGLQRTESDKTVNLKKSEDSNTNKFNYRKSKSVPALFTQPNGDGDVQNSVESDAIVFQRGRHKKINRRKKKNKVVKLDTSLDSEKEAYETEMTGKKRNKEHMEGSIVDGNGSEYVMPSAKALRSHLKNENISPVDLRDGPDIAFQDEFSLKLPKNSPAIVTKLVTTTAVTRNKFRDPCVLYNPKSIQDILEAWNTQLSNMAIEFEEECFKSLEQPIQDNMTRALLAYLKVESIALLFTQLSAGFSEISNVATLCLETSLYPARCSILKPHEIGLLNFDITFDEIKDKAMLDIKKILNEEKRSNKSEQKEQPNESLVEATCNVPDGTTNVLKLLSDDPNDPKHLLSSDAKEIQFDRRSLSTIVSECETTVSNNDQIFDVINHELKTIPMLCENNVTHGLACDSCIIDKCRACFILRFFPVLNFSKIQTLLKRKGSCRWRTWSACIAHLKRLHKDSTLSKLISTGDIFQITSELQHVNTEVFFGNVDRLIVSYPKLVMQFLYDHKISPWEVTMIYNMSFVHKDSEEDYLCYALHYFHTLKSEIPDTLLLKCSLEIALAYSPKQEELFCDCGKERPGSNAIQWHWNELLLEIITILCQDHVAFNNFLLMRVSGICKTHGYWDGYINLLKKQKRIGEALLLLYQLQDEKLLFEITCNNYGGVNEETCSSLLFAIDHRLASTDHNCKPLDGWSPTMTLEKVVKAIAMTCGTKFVLSILEQTSNIHLHCDLYTCLVRAAEIEHHQEKLVTKLIEVASGNVWAERKKLMHLELESIKNAELKGGDVPHVFPKELSSNVEYAVNESDTVWGRCVDISSAECPVCMLPLFLKTTSTTSAGLIVFQCGHSFHKICLPECACLVCYHDNFSSLV